MRDTPLKFDREKRSSSLIGADLANVRYGPAAAKFRAAPK
jgi:hypothetical protein